MKLSPGGFRHRIVERLGTDAVALPPARDSSLPRGWNPQRVREFLRRELDPDSAHTERVVIAGAGGHAKVILGILEESGEFEVAGCTNKAAGGTLLGLPVLGDDGVLPELAASGFRAAFAAVGDNRVRRDVIRQLREAGFRLINAVSRRAIVSPRARLGEGVAVMPGAVINVGAEIEDGAIVNTGATVDHDCRIAACAHIAPGVNLAGCVSVGEGAFLGVGSRVIPGVSIGAWTVVAAGAVVIGDIPAHVTAVGVPASIRARRT
jgi:UDP-perosamine 4-acetyltransferase